MRTETVEIYKYGELSDSAKDTARQWYREASSHDNDWSEWPLEDAEIVADMLGISLKTHSVPLMNGSTRQKPCIWFSGFSSQGDGACFEGNYSYKKGSVKAVKQHAPEDMELNNIALGLKDIQHINFFGLSANVSQSGHYNHEFSTSINVERDDYIEMTETAEDDVIELLRDFMRWIYKQLEAEYKYANSDETIADNIEANEYEFEVNGELH